MPLFRVGKPRCRVIYGTGGALPNGEATVSWESIEESEGDLMWPGASNAVMTVSKEGLYLIQANMTRSVLSSGSSTFSVKIVLNGAVHSRVSLPAVGGTVAGGCTWMGQCPAGTDITVLATGATGAGTTWTPATYSHLMATRLGPKRWT